MWGRKKQWIYKWNFRLKTIRWINKSAVIRKSAGNYFISRFRALETLTVKRLLFTNGHTPTHTHTEAFSVIQDEAVVGHGGDLSWFFNGKTWRFLSLSILSEFCRARWLAGQWTLHNRFWLSPPPSLKSDLCVTELNAILEKSFFLVLFLVLFFSSFDCFQRRRTRKAIIDSCFQFSQQFFFFSCFHHAKKCVKFLSWKEENAGKEDDEWS